MPNLTDFNVFDTILLVNADNEPFVTLEDDQIKFYNSETVNGITEPAIITGVVPAGPLKQIITLLHNLGLVIDQTTLT